MKRISMLLCGKTLLCIKGNFVEALEFVIIGVSLEIQTRSLLVETGSVMANVQEPFSFYDYGIPDPPCERTFMNFPILLYANYCR